MSVLILLLNISSAGGGKLYPIGVSRYVSKAALNSCSLVDFFNMFLMIIMTVSFSIAGSMVQTGYYAIDRVILAPLAKLCEGGIGCTIHTDVLMYAVFPEHYHDSMD